jgi:1-phosphatidylinositol-4-phosphate 5-kinase
MIHHTGTISTSTGERYTGDWADNKRHGHGELFRSNGDKFSGGFKRHLYDGVGTLTASDGTVYEGASLCGVGHADECCYGNAVRMVCRRLG